MNKHELTALAFLGPLEARVMDVVWSRGKVTVRQVYEVLRREHELAYTTVMTVLGNLHKKGLVKRTQQGQAYVYSATQTRTEFIQTKVATLMDTLLDRFSEPALAHLIQRVGESDPKHLAELERIVAERRRAVAKDSKP
jgi:predicted transcriptional regulator